jgi:hypothetical protein
MNLLTVLRLGIPTLYCFILCKVTTIINRYSVENARLFSELLNQPKVHAEKEIALQRVANGACSNFETSYKESKHKNYRR